MTFTKLRKYNLWLIVILMSSCIKSKPILSVQELTTQWAQMSLYITQHTPANSPTYASRALAYIGLTMYESVVHSDSTYQSIAPYLNQLGELPLPKNGVKYNWPLSLNAAQASILKSIYLQTSDKNKQKIDSLEQAMYSQFYDFSENEVERSQSVAYGRAVAKAIFEWSKSDGGHRAYLKNFPKDYEHPKHKGAWQPPLYAQSFSHHPLHPYWGQNRTFLISNTKVSTPPMIEYNEKEGSDYYKEFLAVYEKDKILTQQEKEAAIWWGDDPDESFTPPGHSYFFACQAIQAADVGLLAAAETYAKVSLAVADSFRNCWKWKYHYFSERPNTFIPKFIDQEFVSFWPDPPFPSFPSGHAINAGAAATILTDMYGESFRLADSSHVDRERDELREVDFVPRSFGSFWEMAHETADSRFYGGIHTPQDNSVGLNKGKEIAENILKLPWRK